MFITKKKLENLLNEAKNEAANEIHQRYEHNYELNNIHNRIDEVFNKVEKLEMVLNSQGKTCSCKKTLNG
jgi:division protein CdvB (Snf7/Vps24/ESCRT-III family)